MAHAGDSPPELSDLPLLREARGLWERGRLDAALEAFRRAVERHPRNVKALLEAARALGGRYEVVEAERLLERAEALAGDDARVAPVIAQSYRLIFRPHRAVAALARLRSSAGGLAPDMLAELATLYEQTDRVEEAHAAIAECIGRAAGHDEPRLVLARIERRRGNAGEAERILADISSRAGGHPMLHVRAWGELCELRDRGGDYDGAVAAIERAKALLRAM